MTLSIIIPVYNVEKYIRPCIESIYRQGLNENDFEIILVNDGTPDNSIGVISDILNQHSNIIVLEQENQGQATARNLGLSQARGKHVIMIDSDDLLIDNTLMPILDKAQTHWVKSPSLLYLANYLQEGIPDKKQHKIYSRYHL